MQAVVSNGKYKGTYTGRVKVRRRGDFDLVTMAGKKISTTRKTTFKVLQRMDGYEYSFSEAIPLGS